MTHAGVAILEDLLRGVVVSGGRGGLQRRHAILAHLLQRGRNAVLHEDAGGVDVAAARHDVLVLVPRGLVVLAAAHPVIFNRN